MCNRSIIAVVAITLSLWGSTVLAQCGCGVPATIYAPVVTSYPVYSAPTVTYYAPAYSEYRTPYYTTYYTTVVPYATYSSAYVTFDAPVVYSWTPYYGVPCCGFYP
jgi:hypothetical protein